MAFSNAGRFASDWNGPSRPDSGTLRGTGAGRPGRLARPPRGWGASFAGGLGPRLQLLAVLVRGPSPKWAWNPRLQGIAVPSTTKWLGTLLFSLGFLLFFSSVHKTHTAAYPVTARDAKLIGYLRRPKSNSGAKIHTLLPLGGAVSKVNAFGLGPLDYEGVYQKPYIHAFGGSS